MYDLLRELRYAVRTLSKAPLFAAVAILTLALGIGANSAVFTLIDAILLRPLPFPEPDRLVFVWEETNMFGLKDSVVALGNYTEWRARNHSFQQMGAMEWASLRLTGQNEPLLVEGQAVTSGVFGALQVKPALGRLFREDEDRPGAPKVAVLSDGLWRRMFGADPNILGRTLQLSDMNFQVVGIMPPGFQFPSSGTDIWVPIGAGYGWSEFTNKGRHNFAVVARLAPGVSLERANQDIRAIAESLKREYPRTNRNVGAFVALLRDHFVAGTGTVLLLLAGAVAFILLIACANIANLLLARATNRSREVAIRAAVGAGRLQLVRQLLIENLLLAAAGGSGGLLLALWSVRFLRKLVPSGISAVTGLTVDVRVMAFTLGMSLVTALLFGVVPVLRLLRVDLQHVLKQGSGSRIAGGGRAVERALVVSEVALAFVLTIGAGLMIQTFARLRAVDPGFRTRNILTMRVGMSDAIYRSPARQAAFYNETLRRIRALPGVVSAGYSNGVPIAFKGWVNGFTIEGQAESSNSNYRVVTPDYLATLGVPLRSGRMLDAHDTAESQPVALVNETFQRTFWRGASAVGKRFRFGTETPWVTVVGVVGDVHQMGLDAAAKAEMYLPVVQQRSAAMWLAVQTLGNPAALSAAVRREIRAVEKDLPLTRVATMEEVLDQEVFARRVQMLLLGIFAGIALLLASLGIYGVLAYMVSRRTQEIGVRMALGARPGDVLRAVVGHGMALSAAGIAVGLAVAFAVTRLLSKLLFGVTPTDPVTFAAVAALLLGVAALASYIPARRAMRVDPVLALREE